MPCANTHAQHALPAEPAVAAVSRRCKRRLARHANARQGSTRACTSSDDAEFVLQHSAQARAHVDQDMQHTHTLDNSAEPVQVTMPQYMMGIAPAPVLAPVLPSRHTTLEGFLWALVMLGAVRLGRKQAEDNFLDYDGLREVRQRRLEGDKEMYARRLELQRIEAQQKAEEATKRMVAARRKAEQVEQQQRLREARYKQEADREAARLSAIRDAEQRAFEEKESKARAELQQRLATEQKVIQEQQQRARQELERKRREAEEQRQAAAMAKQRAAEEREQELAAQRAQREAERQALRRLEKSFAVRVEGTATIHKPEKGAKTSGRIPREATLQLSLTLSTALSGESTTNELYRDAADAAAGALDLAGAAASTVTEQYQSAVRLQNMTGQGALQHMEEVEVQHWLRLACCRSMALGHQALQALVNSHSQKPTGQQAPMQVRTAYGVLPPDHQQRTEVLLDSGVAMLQAGNASGCANTVLQPMMEQNEQAFAEGLSAPAPDHVGSTLTLALFLDHMYQTRPAKRVEASPWYEAATAMVQDQLNNLLADAPKDSLMPLAQYMQHALGNQHIVTSLVQKAAEANLSSATKARKQEQQKLLEAELAAQLLEEEWPDEDEVRAARMQVREEATPVPERAWALRNVAATLSLGGPGEKARARTLLEKALSLKEQWLDDLEHPGLLVELNALGGVLEANAEWQADAGSVRSRQLRILSLIASRYLSTGDTASAVLLLEAAVRQYEEVLGIRHPGIATLSKKAERLLDGLDPELRSQVMQKSRSAASVVKQMTDLFAEQPDVYKQATGKRNAVQRWSEGDAELLTPLV